MEVSGLEQMNRRSFISSLASVAALTACHKGWAFAESAPSQYSLMDWAGNLQANHSVLRIDASSDAMDYFRVGYAKGETRMAGMSKTIQRSGGRTTFNIENVPYRYTEKGYLVMPYITVVIDNSRLQKLNPSWVFAEEELCIAYSLDDNTQYLVRYNRTTYIITESIEVTPEHRKHLENIVDGHLDKLK